MHKPTEIPALLEARRLLDMHLEEGVDRGGGAGGRAADERVRVAALPAMWRRG